MNYIKNYLLKITVLSLCIFAFVFAFDYLNAADPKQDIQITETKNADSIAGIKAIFFVKAPIKNVWKCLVNPEDLPKISPSVIKIVKIKDIDANNILWEYNTKTIVGKKIFQVRRTVDEKNYQINWIRTEGDFSYYGGSWSFKESKEFQGWTECAYSSFVDAGRFVPNFTTVSANKKNINEMVPNIRQCSGQK